MAEISENVQHLLDNTRVVDLLLPGALGIWYKAGYSEPDIVGVLGENLIELYDQHAWSA